MRTYTIILTAAKIQELSFTGTYFRILDAADDVEVRVPEHGFKLDLEAGLGIDTGRRFSKLQLLSATNQTVKLVVGIGKADDSRASGAVDANIQKGATLSTVADVAVGAVAAIALAAATTRKEAVLQNVGSVDVRLGDSNVTTGRGLLLTAGSSMVLETTAAIYAVCASASTLAVLEVLE